MCLSVANTGQLLPCVAGFGCRYWPGLGISCRIWPFLASVGPGWLLPVVPVRDFVLDSRSKLAVSVRCRAWLPVSLSSVDFGRPLT